MLSMIKRDVLMRFHYSKHLVIIQFVLFLLITFFFIFIFELNNISKETEWISISRFWNGFSESDLEEFKRTGEFRIPYLWLVFQLLFFISLRTFFAVDLTKSSGFIIMRTGFRRFVISKIISLLIYTALYISVFLLCIFLVSLLQYLMFGIEPSFITNWKIVSIFYFFLIMALFLEAIFFEIGSVIIGEIITFIIVFTFNFLSIFSKNIFLIGNYTMFSRWSESIMLKQNIITLFSWVGILVLIFFTIEMIIVKKIDLISEKGEN
ncbi:hypothetical protein [Terribacillus sp. 7520-G]|uniref:hypothetical protein n=1 Tax=Terribacillus sp. 7520-G TaxID=2025389 RepID=UPI000BA78E43|nr:hypothetical protein [Terribacillus sp. 7520-G]PAD39521.1 hypothetical protein CHH53_04735 [Terribacillus sp. 7520-G]